MKNVLILGAGGQVARHVIDRLQGVADIHLSLYLRNSERLKNYTSADTDIIEGDILDENLLFRSLEGQDIVYVNINGQEDEIAQQVVLAMDKAGVKRLIFIAAIGIYNEVPGEFGKWNRQMIGPYIDRYRKAADIIEATDLEYTILRPTWYTDKDEVSYDVSKKGQPLTGTEISRKSVADLIYKLIQDPTLYVYDSLGLEKPGTEGNKPAFMS